MRLATLFGAVLFAGSMWLGACGPPYPPGAGFCDGSGKHCSCDNAAGCNYNCAGPGCDVDCHNADFCDLGCGDHCHAECHDADTCDIQCGADCHVDCHSLGVCSVTMISGEVDCHDNDDCDIRCLQPNGATVPADDCGKNKWRCGC